MHLFLLITVICIQSHAFIAAIAVFFRHLPEILKYTANDIETEKKEE